MELKDFVKQTLVQIVKAVEEAQSEVNRSAVGAIVSPGRGDMFGGNARTKGAVSARGGFIEDISFDLAITTVDISAKQGQAGIFVWSVGVGGKTKSENQNTTVSRIQFSIPVVLPLHRSAG